MTTPRRALGDLGNRRGTRQQADNKTPTRSKLQSLYKKTPRKTPTRSHRRSVSDVRSFKEKDWVRWAHFMLMGEVHKPVKEGEAPSLFRQLYVKEMEDKIRMEAKKLQQEDGTLMANLEKEISQGKLTIRADIDLRSDIGLKREVTEMLVTNYHPTWLRFAMEVVCGTTIKTCTGKSTKRAQQVLKKVVAGRLLKARKGEKNKSDFHSRLLKEMIELVTFLDRAQKASLIKGLGLFLKSASVDSPCETLLGFSKFLAGEGCLIKHLNQLHFKLWPQDSDSCPPTLNLSSTRAHDALQALGREGLADVPSCGVSVDGAGSELAALVLLQKTGVEHTMSTVAPKLSGLLQKEISRILGRGDGRELSFDHKIALLTWCRAICGRATAAEDAPRIKVVDFTASFQDGRVLALITQFYHPELVDSPQRLQHTAYCHTVVSKVVEVLGGVPHMLSALAASATSDTKASASTDHAVMVTFLSLFCLRLLECQRTRVCIVRVQQVWRGYYVRAHLLARMAAAAAVTAWARATMARLARTYRLQGQHLAATAVQSAVRGAKARWQLAQASAGASRIQACARRCLAQREAAALATATRKIRSCVHTWMAKFFKRIQLNAIVKIQAVIRLASVRTMVWVQHQAACVIETSVRRVQAQARLHEALCAAVVLQRVARGALARGVLLEQHRCAVAIQTRFRTHSTRRWLDATVAVQRIARGAAVRQMMTQQHNAAAKLETHFRMHRRVCMYRHVLTSIEKMQSCVKMHQARSMLLEAKAATVSIQRVTRGAAVRTMVWAQHQAACVIETSVRRVQAQARLHEALCAAVVLQRVARGALARGVLLEQHRCAVAIQTRFRTHSTRRWLDATVAVQRIARGAAVRQMMTQQHNAAAKLETHFRMHRRVCMYRHVLTSIEKMQSCVKMHQARSMLLEAKAATVSIQRVTRGAAVRTMVWAQHQAACVIETSVRRVQAQARLHEALCAAVVLQRVARGALARGVLLEQHRCAVAIQTRFRTHSDMVAYACVLESAVTLQALLRAAHARWRFEVQRRGSVLLQRVFRVQHGDKWLKATEIQRVVRGFQHARNAASFRISTLAVRSHVRIWVAQRQRRTKLRLVARVQAHARGAAARALLASQQRACAVMQSITRMHMVRATYRSALARVRKLQTAGRRWQQLRRYQTLKRSAIAAQRMVRGAAVRQMMTQQHNAAAKLETHFRMHRRVCMYRHVLTSIEKMQSCVKMHQARSMLLEAKAATVSIQRVTRGAAVRTMVWAQHQAACVIETSVRRVQAQARLHEALCAAVVLQRVARGALARGVLLEQHRCAVAIQTRFRTHSDMVAYLIVLRAVTLLQARHRSLSARVLYCSVLSQFRCLQALVRGWCGRAVFLRKRAAAQSIQAQARTRRAVLNRGARAVQSLTRGRQQRAEFARTRVDLEKARDFRILLSRSAALLVFQSAWRGVHQRASSDRRDPRVKRARERLQSSEAKAKAKPEQSLRNRTHVAVGELRAAVARTSMTGCVQACTTLQRTTELSWECCRQAVGEGVVGMLLLLISKCNRSEPHCKAILAALTVIRHVVKTQDLIASFAATEKCCETLSTVVYNFSKNERILRPALHLLLVKCSFDAKVGATLTPATVLEHKACLRKLAPVYKVMQKQRAPKPKHGSASSVTSFGRLMKKLAAAGK